ncbi:acyl-CoA thioesterase [Trujillonella endophytica]|uniref:acyl-CoA thioesterase n=1 Tax=Trujillonella endophytica TaxID=673521 RepID=UPI000B869882|nr:acyl-CoA thioesterase domain-containing protein [Trujillella endophytica]
MPVFTRRVARRPGTDGSEREGGHAPYFLVVESVSAAWEQVLEDLGEGVLPLRELGVVHIAFDYRREVFVTPADFEVDVVRVGRSSVEFAVRLVQDGRLAVEATVVVAHVTADRSTSSPLSGRQRAALQAIAVPRPAVAG